jgi:hypothetical protein
MRRVPDSMQVAELFGRVCFPLQSSPTPHGRVSDAAEDFSPEKAADPRKSTRLINRGSIMKDLREDQWERIKESVPGKAGDVGRTGGHRRCIEAVMRIGRTGARCRACTDCGLVSTNSSDGGRTRGSGK